MAKTNTHVTMVVQTEVNFDAVIGNVSPCHNTATASQIAMTVQTKYRPVAATLPVYTLANAAVNVFRGQAFATVTWIVMMAVTNVIVVITTAIQQCNK